MLSGKDMKFVELIAAADQAAHVLICTADIIEDGPDGTPTIGDDMRVASLRSAGERLRKALNDGASAEG